MQRRTAKEFVQRQQRPDACKAEAVKLPDRVDAPEAADQLGSRAASIYNQRTMLNRKESISVAEDRLEVESA